MSQPVVSIIIAVYSELDTLNETVAQLLQYFADLPIEIIIVAHPNSGEACLHNGRALAEGHPCITFDIQKFLPGQGFAYRQAIEQSNGYYIMLMNADLETAPKDARTLYNAITQGQHDMVIASRWAKGAEFDAASYGYGKIMLNFLFQRLFSLIFNTPITDLSFCYKIGRAELFKKLCWVGTQHEFALETSLVPIALGMRVTEIPTSWRRRREGISHFNFCRNIRHVKLAMHIATAKFFRHLPADYGWPDRNLPNR